MPIIRLFSRSFTRDSAVSVGQNRIFDPALSDNASHFALCNLRHFVLLLDPLDDSLLGFACIGSNSGSMLPDDEL